MSDLWRELREAIAARGAEEVLIEVDRTGYASAITGVELQRRVAGAVRILEREGLHRDDIVVLFLDNSATTVVTILALLAMGAIPVFAKTDYRRVELTTLFRDIDPDTIICEEAHLPVIYSYVENRTVLVHNETGLVPAQSASRRHGSYGISDEICSLNCTYRGSGDLLASMTPHELYRHGARVLQEGLQGERGEKMLFNIPLSHIFTLVGCLFVPLLYGMTAVLVQSFHPRIIFNTINGLAIEHMTAVPEIYRLLGRSAEKESSFPTLRTFVSGGSLLTAADYHSLVDTFDAEVLHGYGLTEFTPVSRNARGAGRAGTIGPICDGIDVAIDAPDEEGRGEIIIRAPSVSKGYFNRPLETSKAHRDGWFHTGDCGYFDDGHLVFSSEIKATGKVNGVMVDLNEIRRTVLGASSARDVQIIKTGNSITALLELPESADIEQEKVHLSRVLRHQLAAYKVPRRVDLLE